MSTSARIVRVTDRAHTTSDAQLQLVSLKRLTDELSARAADIVKTDVVGATVPSTFGSFANPDLAHSVCLCPPAFFFSSVFVFGGVFFLLRSFADFFSSIFLFIYSDCVFAQLTSLRIGRVTMPGASGGSQSIQLDAREFERLHAVFVQ